MKKIYKYFGFILLGLLLSGCDMSNTPTKRVENFLDTYTHHNESVLSQLNEMINQDTLMTDEEKEEYRDIMKRQYKDMTYEIKDERIDGNTATVTAEIEVYDYYKVNRETEEYYNNNRDEFKTDNDNNDEGLIEKAKEGVENAIEEGKEMIEEKTNDMNDTSSDRKYIEYRLDKLKDAKDRIKYTIDFTLTKDNDKWKINDIDEQTRQKIHGLYEH